MLCSFNKGPHVQFGLAMILTLQRSAFRLLQLCLMRVKVISVGLSPLNRKLVGLRLRVIAHLNCDKEGELQSCGSRSFQSFNIEGKEEVSKERHLVNGMLKI